MKISFEYISSQLKKSGRFSIRSYGNSMYPLIRNEDVINVSRKPWTSIQVDDVITFKSGKNLVTHRVIYRSPTGKFFITKGDNNPSTDKRISHKVVLGKVLSIKRNDMNFQIESLYLFQSTVYLQEIFHFSQFFTSRQVPFVFLKGLPLHLYYQKSHTRRLYADIDVLIPPALFPRIRDYFKSRQYIQYFSPLHPGQQFIKSKPAEISFYKIINGVKVVFDVHLEPVFLMVQLTSLNLLYSRKLLNQFAQELLSHKKEVIISGTKIPILDHNYLIIYLALHLFHDNFRGYNGYFFLDYIIRHKKTDFKEIFAITKKYRMANFIYPVFVLLKRDYKTPIESHFIFRLKYLTPLYSLRLIPKDLFSLQGRVSAGIVRFRNIFFLSPELFMKRVLIFLQPDVIFFLFWSIWLFISRKVQVLFYTAYRQKL